MFYSLPTGTAPIYERDSEGNIQYIDEEHTIPIETGETEPVFGDVVKFKGAIFSQLESAILRAWGSDNTNNYAVLVVDKHRIPELRTGARIWRTNKVILKDGRPDETTANYMVSGVMTEELNETSYYLTVLDGGDDART